MVGIIVASHGQMAQGLLDTTKWFFGDQPQFEAICLQPGQDLEEFDQIIQDTIARVNSGDGVILFCDLLFGTPCNRSALALRDGVEVITGMNLPVILELLGCREFTEESLKELTTRMIEVAREGIKDLKAVLDEVA